MYCIMKQHEHTKPDKQDRERRMRETIKKAAFLLMAERGIDQVSMREIAEKVKVTKPVLYYYFKNKEDLCRSIVDEHEQQFFVLMEEAYAQGHSLEGVLKSLLRAHLEFFRKEPINSKFVMQMIAYTLNKKFPAQTRRPAPEVLLGNYLAQKEKDKRLPAGAASDISRLVSALFFKVMVNSYVDTYIYGGKHSDSYNEQTIERLVQIILLGIKKYYEEHEK